MSAPVGALAAVAAVSVEGPRHEGYLIDLEAGDEPTARAGEPASVQSLRSAARAIFAERGFPTVREEAWKYTNLAPLAAQRFRRRRAVPRIEASQIAPFLYEGCAALVFVDGCFVSGLSRLDGLPGNAFVGCLVDALVAGNAVAVEHLGSGSGFPLTQHPLAALNTALFTDGTFIHVPSGTVIETPIQILYASTGELVDDLPVLSLPRTLIVAEEHSQVRVIESYVTLGGAATSWSCGVTEIVVGDGAHVDHYKVQRESLAGYHTALQRVALGRGCHLSSHALSLGAALARHDVLGSLDGEGADANLNGLYLVRGRQHVDTHMAVDHRAAHCGSHELYKGVLDGKSRAVFNGLIHVHPGAQKTDAKQTNRNLLLSQEALVNTNPQLRIFADDVKCTHGSTVGQLDPVAVFYLRSRGIGEEAARSLLTYAFALDIVERIAFEPLRHELEAYLFAWLPKGDVVAQAV